MRCNNGHDHPPMHVVGSTYNETNQPRPYHCPDCWQANKPDKRSGNWPLTPYATPQAAEQAGHDRPCAFCFPSN
jgi:hypothetical protein